MDSIASLFLAPKSDKTQLLVRMIFFLFPLYFQISFIVINASAIISTWSKFKGLMFTDTYNMNIYIAILIDVAYILSKMYLIFRIRYSWFYTVIICLMCVLDMFVYWIMLCGSTAVMSFSIWGTGRGTSIGDSSLFGCNVINPNIGNLTRPSLTSLHDWMKPIIFIITAFMLILDLSSNNKCVTINTS